jgi:hypothetical protein
MKYISRSPVVYLLPLFHLIACITIHIVNPESGLQWLIVADFPFSFVLVMLGWPRDNFMFWFGTLGTLWWYFLSWGAQQIFEGYKAGRRR